jgi:hypothetical protein
MVEHREASLPGDQSKAKAFAIHQERKHPVLVLHQGLQGLHQELGDVLVHNHTHLLGQDD